jgi:hypothetical protein
VLVVLVLLAQERLDHLVVIQQLSEILLEEELEAVVADKTMYNLHH